MGVVSRTIKAKIYALIGAHIQSLPCELTHMGIRDCLSYLAKFLFVRQVRLVSLRLGEDSAGQHDHRENTWQINNDSWTVGRQTIGNGRLSGKHVVPPSPVKHERDH